MLSRILVVAPDTQASRVPLRTGGVRCPSAVPIPRPLRSLEPLLSVPLAIGALIFRPDMFKVVADVLLGLLVGVSNESFGVAAALATIPPRGAGAGHLFSAYQSEDLATLNVRQIAERFGL